MKEIVIVSGKGGTGKTSITSAFAYLAGRNAIIADCDVDAANMHLLMNPEHIREEDFYSGELAFINEKLCTGCKKCLDVCRFDAINLHDGKCYVDESKCEGCGYCKRVCPENAISYNTRLAGRWFISKIDTGSCMVHAHLGIGADNSGKLIARVKKEARAMAKKKYAGLIIVDGPPGLSCPVISSLSGANYAIIVTEPSVSGVHDLKRLTELIKGFKIPAGCIINKADINEKMNRNIKKILKKEKIVHLADVPYDESFTEAMTAGKTIIEFNNKTSIDIIEIWKKILKQNY